MVEELLQPRTDGGVVAQVLAVLVVAAAAAWATRRTRRTWWPLVVGVALVLLALMGLRTAH